MNTKPLNVRLACALAATAAVSMQIMGAAHQAIAWQKVDSQHPWYRGNLSITQSYDRVAEEALTERMRPLEDLARQARRLFDAGDDANAEKAIYAGYEFADGESDPKERNYAEHAAHFQLDNLLGQIYLRRNENEKALAIFLPQSRNYSSTQPVSLDVALAYVQEGNYDAARRFYTDNSIMRFGLSGLTSGDMPGTDDLRRLTASIKLARGFNTFLEYKMPEAERDLQVAHKLVPYNALTAYYYGCAMVENGKPSEAKAVLDIAKKGPKYIADVAIYEQQHAGFIAAARHPELFHNHPHAQ